VNIPALDENCFWLLDAVPDATIIVDAAGRIFYSNALAQALFGYTQAELDGLSVDDLLPPRYREAHARTAARMARTARAG
jgi:PAS domain S-box-containing protein